MKHQTRPGSVAVEMALCAPLVAFALVALADLCLAALTASNVQNATAAASTLCSQGKANCNQSTIRQVCGIPDNWTVTVSTDKSNATDAYGQAIFTATITIQSPYEWMTPGINDLVGGDNTGPPNTITRKATTPIINTPPDH